MELKLVKDKLMTGNFTVVDIYLEGLKPRIEKQWKTIGKAPKKKELELIEEKDVSASLQKAKEDRDKWEKEHGGQQAAEVKKEQNKIMKIVRPLTLDNGMMLSSLQELRDVLPNLEADIMKIHVTDEKNDIANWITKEIDPDLGAKLLKVKDKKAIIDQIELFVKEQTPKKEEKPQETPKEQK
jgi:hypothetical protein